MRQQYVMNNNILSAIFFMPSSYALVPEKWQFVCMLASEYILYYLLDCKNVCI